MLLLKLLLVPLCLGLVSQAGRIWGPQIAGWLAGFPVVAGPILLFVACDQGDAFAAHSAIASLAAVIALIAFGLAYSWASLRLSWAAALLLALAAWLACADGLSHLAPSRLLAAMATLLSLLLAPLAYPRLRQHPVAASLSKAELVLRMAMGSALTLLVTSGASAVGPSWSGLLAVAPVISSVLAVFSQRAHGPAYVAHIFRGQVFGLYALAAFCLALSLLLGHTGTGAAFGTALALALLVQLGSKRLINTAMPAELTVESD